MLNRAITLVCIAALTGTAFPGPKLIRQVNPQYPAGAELAGVTRSVRLEATVAPDGTVGDVRTLIGQNPVLEQAAVEAVRQWQYEPVLFEGKPVAFMTNIEMHFALPAAIAIQTYPVFFPGMHLVHKVDPEEARINRISGTVNLRVLIGEEGTVERIQTVDGDPVLAAAFEEAVRQWRYEPVKIAGQPVKSLADIQCIRLTTVITSK